MTKITETEIVVKAAKQVRGYFKRKRAPADLDDVEQDAALAAVVAIRSGRFEPTRGIGYLKTAGIREAGLAAARALAACSIPERAQNSARALQGRVHVSDGGEDREEGENRASVTLVSYTTPERILSARERSLAAARLETRVRIEIRRRAMRWDKTKRELLEAVMGENAPAPDNAGELAWRTGASQRLINSVLNEAQKAVEESREQEEQRT